MNELSNTIDLESTLVRAEALYRRFQRQIEAMDKKSNFPAPKLRQRPTHSKSTSSSSLKTSPPTTPGSSSSVNNNNSTAITSSVDSVSAGGTNSGSGSNSTSTGAGNGRGGNSAGKGKASPRIGETGGEMQDQRPRIISPELRELMSRKVEILPRKVVRKGGEGISSLKK